MVTKAFTAAAAGLLLLSAPASAQEAVTLPGQERQLAITLYNQNLAFFQEQRQADLARGANRLAVEGVAETLMPQSLYLEAAGLSLLSQSYQPATLSPGSLARAYLGEMLGVMLPAEDGTDAKVWREGRLVSLAGGPMVEVDGSLQTVALEDLRFPGVPSDLRREDALLIDVLSEDSGSTDIELGYLATGFSWQADYIARYDEAAGELALIAQASLSNNTGEGYEDAAISLVAGEINRQRGAPPIQPMMAEAMEMRADVAAMPKQEAAGDYYRYVLPGRVDLPANSLKQVTFLEAARVPVERRYRLEGLIMQGGNRGQVSGPMNATAELTFDNSESAGVGRPLPAGTWRVYGDSPEGGRLLLGEAGTGHLPEDAEVELLLGRSFDLRGEAAVTAFQRVSNRSYEIAQRVTVTNAKSEDAVVEVVGVFPPDLRVLSESLGHEQEAAGRLIWSLPVPAEGEAAFEFRVLVTY